MIDRVVSDLFDSYDDKLGGLTLQELERMGSTCLIRTSDRDTFVRLVHIVAGMMEADSNLDLNRTRDRLKVATRDGFAVKR